MSLHGLVCESVGNADLLSDDFDSKQSRESVDLWLIFHLPPSRITFVLMSPEVRRLFLDLDPYGGTDILGTFSFHLKRTADVLAPVLVLCFGGFPSGEFPFLQDTRQCHTVVDLIIYGQ